MNIFMPFPEFVLFQYFIFLKTARIHLLQLYFCQSHILIIRSRIQNFKGNHFLVFRFERGD